MPRASNAEKAFGPSWMPAPISPSCGACSSAFTLKPRRVSASAAASPPMPPPATSTGRSCRVVAMVTPPSLGIGWGASVERDLCALDDLGVATRVRIDLLRDLVGRRAERLEREPGQALAHFGIGKRLPDALV